MRVAHSACPQQQPSLRKYLLDAGGGLGHGTGLATPAAHRLLRDSELVGRVLIQQVCTQRRGHCAAGTCPQGMASGQPERTGVLLYTRHPARRVMQPCRAPRQPAPSSLQTPRQLPAQHHPRLRSRARVHGQPSAAQRAQAQLNLLTGRHPRVNSFLILWSSPREAEEREGGRLAGQDTSCRSRRSTGLPFPELLSLPLINLSPDSPAWRD